MCKKKIGMVAESEKNEILKTYERKMALKELKLTLDTPNLASSTANDLLERINTDIKECEINLQKWWSIRSKQYEWVLPANNHLLLEFDSNEIYLVNNAKKIQVKCCDNTPKI